MLKSLFVVAFLTLPVVAQEAPQRPLDVGGITELVAEKLKEARLATSVDLNGTIGAAAILPLLTFHDKAGTADLVEVGAGGQLSEGGRKQPVLSVAVNAPAVSARIWDFEWARAHVRRAKFPPIFIGPRLLLPMPGVRWTWREALGGTVSVRFGGGSQ